MKWAIFNDSKGYMYEDEDYLPGTTLYDPIVDDFTILFDDYADAERYCENGDRVVAVDG